MQTCLFPVSLLVSSTLNLNLTLITNLTLTNPSPYLRPNPSPYPKVSPTCECRFDEAMTLKANPLTLTLTLILTPVLF